MGQSKTYTHTHVETCHSYAPKSLSHTSLCYPPNYGSIHRMCLPHCLMGLTDAWDGPEAYGNYWKETWANGCLGWTCKFCFRDRVFGLVWFSSPTIRVSLWLSCLLLTVGATDYVMTYIHGATTHFPFSTHVPNCQTHTTYWYLPYEITMNHSSYHLSPHPTGPHS